MVTADPGYEIQLGPTRYDGFKDGTPFTLIDAWREVEGVGGAKIFAPTGRLVLADAGSMSARRDHVRSNRKGRRR